MNINFCKILNAVKGTIWNQGDEDFELVARLSDEAEKANSRNCSFRRISGNRIVKCAKRGNVFPAVDSGDVIFVPAEFVGPTFRLQASQARKSLTTLSRNDFVTSFLVQDFPE